MYLIQNKVNFDFISNLDLTKIQEIGKTVPRVHIEEFNMKYLIKYIAPNKPKDQLDTVANIKSISQPLFKRSSRKLVQKSSAIISPAVVKDLNKNLNNLSRSSG